MAIQENTENVIEAPAPTAWPMIFALGLTLAFAGLVTNVAVSMVGFVLFVAGAVGWFRDVLPVEHRESVRVEPGRGSRRSLRRSESTTCRSAN